MLLVLFLISFSSLYGQKKRVKVVLKPNGKELVTDSIQSAIDKCAGEGGGVVHFSEGVYHSGILELKNNVVLQLDEGSVLRGSDKYEDYKIDAFIYGKDFSYFTIQGEGIIDGVDCYNPKGEEGQLVLNSFHPGPARTWICPMLLRKSGVMTGYVLEWIIPLR